MIYNSILDLVGNTPMVKLKRITEHVPSNVYAKLEFFNPSGSVKDRAALNMINDAEKKGRLNKDSVIVEATSGNTGIALATIAAAKGYRIILVIPDTMSIDKINHIKALGAEVVLTPGVFGMKKAFLVAEEMMKNIPNSFMPDQIRNPANPEIHRIATASEIWNDLNGNIDFFVAASGTGGTVTGTGRGLKGFNPDIKVVCVEPDGSPVLSGGKRGPHKIQGVGPGFIPDVTDVSVFDEIIRVKDDNALETSRKLARMEGIFCGISAGASTYAAIQIAKKYENKNIVVIIPDTGERYLNTELFNEEFAGTMVS